MPTPKVSIIIPLYNAAAYIEQCIHSVLNQTLQDIEIIAVNDGSTDESKQLLDRLALTDERLNVFHQSNKGVSATRNFGLEQATGTYIGFCDADDWMEPGMLHELYNAVELNDCDWAICNVLVIRDEQPAKLRLQLNDEVVNVADDRPAFVHGLMRFNYDNANWNKLYKASIINDQQLRFNEHMQIWEDLLFNLQYLQYINRVAIVAKPLYNYRILNTSLYSGDTGNKVSQFNKLYNYYSAFAERSAGKAEIAAFKTEMARITYNQLLYQAEVQVNKENNYFLEVIKGYRKELQRFNPAIFDYSSAERKGLQGIKRQLLQRHQFFLFSLIIASKPFLRKPYHFVRRLLKK
jgi:glycosyltransferase involved in cell wall biosynthesis